MEPQIVALSLVAQRKNRFACAVGCVLGVLSLAFRVEFDT